MSKIISILLCTLIFFTLTACSKNEKDLAPEIVINLPKGNSVNGYRPENIISNNGEMPDIIPGSQVAVGNKENISINYCGNKNSKIFHKSNCDSVYSMKESNKYFAGRTTLINAGYKPCGKCNP